MPNNIRVELQAFGRSGRKGEHGSGRMIAYDSKAKTGIDLDMLIDERDQKEEERLQDIRIKMIPRVELERELFKKFDKLQEESNNYFKDKDIKYKELQKKALHNKWAFWLDKMTLEINNIYQSKEKGKQEVFQKFDKFALDIKEKMTRVENGIEGYIDEPGELIKLAKYNINEGNFSEAKKNCNRLIEEFGVKYSGFAYYYKAIAIFQPLKDNDWCELIESQRKKWKGHIVTYNEKKEGIQLLKKAILLFEKEIENIQMRSLIISNIEREKQEAGIGSAVDYFSKSNVNEITAIQVHLNAARKSLSQEINILELGQSLSSTILSEEEAREIFNKVINDPGFSKKIKKERLSKKAKIKYHIENTEELKKILGDKFYKKGIKNKEEFIKKENINKEYNFLILDNLSKDVTNLLDAANIIYTRELYVFNRLESSYRLVKFPSPFNYCKKKVLESFKLVENKSIIDRQKVLDIENYLTKEKVWELLLETNALFEEVECVELGQEYRNLLDDKKLWGNEIFKGSGEEIKKALLAALKQDNEVN